MDRQPTCQVLVGPSDGTDSLCRRKEMFDGLVDLRHWRIVAAAREQMRNGEQRNGRCKLGLLAGKIPCRPYQRRGIRVVHGCAVERDVEKACVFCGGKPFALVAVGFDQIHEHLSVIALRIGANQRAIDRKIGRPAHRTQTITAVGLIRTTVPDQKILAEAVDGYFAVARFCVASDSLRVCDGGFPQPLSDERLCTKPMRGPELHPSRGQQLLELSIAAGFEQA